MTRHNFYSSGHSNDKAKKNINKQEKIRRKKYRGKPREKREKKQSRKKI